MTIDTIFCQKRLILSSSHVEHMPELAQSGPCCRATTSTPVTRSTTPRYCFPHEKKQSQERIPDFRAGHQAKIPCFPWAAGFFFWGAWLPVFRRPVFVSRGFHAQLRPARASVQPKAGHELKDDAATLLERLRRMGSRSFFCWFPAVWFLSVFFAFWLV